MNQVIVPSGISGQKAVYDSQNVSLETLANEVALLQLGDVIPLNIKIDVNKAARELSVFESDWVDYLPRTDRSNNRKGLTLTSLPGDSHTDVPSMAQAMVKHGRRISELEFNQPTEVYRSLTSAHQLFDLFGELGRTFLVRSDMGGYFMPHRDHPSIPRRAFRIVVFLSGCGPYEYDWLMDDKKLQIEPGRAYYINTRKMHRTISWVDGSTHLILNVPMTTANVSTVIGNMQHTH